MSENKLNPRIKHIEIGTRKIRKIPIYPMSMHDEMEFAGIIKETLSSFLKENSQVTEQAIISMSIDLITENLSKILELITDQEDDVSMKDIDNTQFAEIAGLIFDMNFGNEDLVKNVQSLSGKIKNLFQSGRQSLTSVKDTQDIA